MALPQIAAGLHLIKKRLTAAIGSGGFCLGCPNALSLPVAAIAIKYI
ncbi:MAG: hypothetical protein PHN35_05645 [Clostridia bacterium]|nr:hypothetical protein [Clostridia bacterium]MDD4797990.1 hypothetical protein [Clostridia bacterium]